MSEVFRPRSKFRKAKELGLGVFSGFVIGGGLAFTATYETLDLIVPEPIPQKLDIYMGYDPYSICPNISYDLPPGEKILTPGEFAVIGGVNVEAKNGKLYGTENIAYDELVIDVKDSNKYREREYNVQIVERIEEEGYIPERPSEANVSYKVSIQGECERHREVLQNKQAFK